MEVFGYKKAETNPSRLSTLVIGPSFALVNLCVSSHLRVFRETPGFVSGYGTLGL
jgi:hypothetical protein